MVEVTHEDEIIGTAIAKSMINSLTDEDNVDISEYEKKLASRELKKMIDFLET